MTVRVLVTLRGRRLLRRPATSFATNFKTVNFPPFAPSSRSVMENPSIDLEMEGEPQQEPESDVSSVYGEPAESPRKRARIQKGRVVASHIRQGARVHPNSAYAGTKEHARALGAKTEADVLQDFLVSSGCIEHLLGF